MTDDDKTPTLPDHLAHMLAQEVVRNGREADKAKQLLAQLGYELVIK